MKAPAPATIPQTPDPEFYEGDSGPDPNKFAGPQSLRVFTIHSPVAAREHEHFAAAAVFTLATNMEMREGTITKIRDDKGFGFLSSEGKGVFFHFRDIPKDWEFDQQLLERRVKFRLIDHGRGPRAVDIQAAD